MDRTSVDVTTDLLQALNAMGRRDGPGRETASRPTPGPASDDPRALYERYRMETSANGASPEAIRFLRRAAAAGSSRAQVELGNLYRRGEGVPQDLHAAWNAYVTAARAGDVEAMTNLGVMYDQGQTVAPDPERACRCYQYAAQRGFVVAQYNLAIMLAEGLGTRRDRAAACHWFGLAAAQGHRPAAEALEWLQEVMAASS